MRGIVFSLLLAGALAACRSASSPADGTAADAQTLRFRLRTGAETGLRFSNQLRPTAAFNVFNYMYFYNGAGVATADFNADGFTDVFFAANQQPNQLYLNRGQLRFDNVSQAAGLPTDSGWSTGVSVTDINHDSLPDLYICRAANYETLQGRNQLLVCEGIENGVPKYRDRAAEYGLDFSGLSTQAVFFDYDRDGDLDMFLLNHAPSHVGRFAERSRFEGSYDALSGDRLYRRDGNRFTDVTRQAGINSTAIGYGLGVVVADINLDGWPDLYVCNDFHENDYLYINNGRGGFTDETSLRTQHTSQYSMGVDAADVTNDGYPDVISMDMLPPDHYMQKRSLGEDNYDIFQMKLRFGYHPFISRNNLQLNRRNKLFSEVGQYAGIAATDWSWSCLWTDFDNDGWKDLFISNGIPKRLNDIDWVNFIASESFQQKLNTQSLSAADFELINQFPEIKLPNYFFRNQGEARFSRQTNIANDLPSFSNGAAYADFDNDGDLDMVVNNIGDEAMLYENELADTARGRHCRVVLQGPATNRYAQGARLLLYQQGELRTYEKQAVHGYLSSMEGPLLLGLAGPPIDSALVLWPDGSYQPWQPRQGETVVLQWKPGLAPFNYGRWQQWGTDGSHRFTDLTASSGLLYDHTENLYQEFNREPLIPYMTSTDGPALAVGDIDGNGLDDVFLGAARGFKNQLYLQQPGGRFAPAILPALAADSAAEDTDAVIADLNGDGRPDLLVASGGNEFYGPATELQPRLYLNTGQGLQKQANAFAGIYCNAGSLAVADFTGDGRPDVFLGGRAQPFAHGLAPRSYLLQNDGQGHFTDITAARAPALLQPGMVKQARSTDWNADGQPDLLLACHWRPPLLVLQQKGRFDQATPLGEPGLWNACLPLDANGDGRPDLLAANLGLNTRLHASTSQPLRLYVGDADGNGTTEQLLTYYMQGQEVAFASKDELQKQLPHLKKKYLYAHDFARASLPDLLGPAVLPKMELRTATQLASGFYLQQPNGRYQWQALPWLAQLSQYNDACLLDANLDGRQDLLLVGNFYDLAAQLGRADADCGLLLINDGQGRWHPETLQGALLTGEARRIRPLQVGGRPCVVVARNNAPAMLLGVAANK